MQGFCKQEKLFYFLIDDNKLSTIICYNSDMNGRLILHSDLNNFYASVECALNPALYNVPLAVSGDPEKRHGVILAKNAIAKAAGVKTGDVIWEAEQKCPGLKLVRPHFDLYMQFSRRVFDIYTRFTPSVEPFGPDECWLDCTGCTSLFGSGEQIARKVLNTIHRETGLTASIGISFTKSLAKLGSDLAEPNEYFIATRADFREKLYHLPVGDLLMVGKKTAAKLEKLNVRTIGELAEADDACLKKLLGVNGLKIKRCALGEDDDAVRQYDKKRKAESVGHGMTAARDICNYDELCALFTFLSDKVSARMMKCGKKGYGIHVNLRFGDLTHKSKQLKLRRAIFSSDDIRENAMRLAKEILGATPFVLRSVTVSVFDLVDESAGTQLSLFDTIKGDKRDSLAIALEHISQKYGVGAVTRANLFGQDFVYDKTDDEDFLPFMR